jgi:6-phosphogluconate dehydrogenase
MGQNFALNMAEHGFKVAVCNRSPAKVEQTVSRAKEEGNLPLTGYTDVAQFIANIAKPRKVVILVMAGKPVDATIEVLSKHMEKGDIIIDGGNEWFPNTLRRAKELEAFGINFIGMGISGGEEGARKGPSLMPGGPKESYDALAPIILKCAAQVDGDACTGYCGPIGSGNYIKMVHNGIEYGDMQLIGECYDILKNVCGMSNKEMAELFKQWNTTELDSYLIEITATILAKDDDQGAGGQVVDHILDKTGSKGTGRWTVQEAAEQSVAAPTLAASLDARYMSARKDERVAASKILSGPTEECKVDTKQIVEDLKAALYCAKIASYAQGLSLIRAASDKNGWNVDLGLCSQMWRGGCIIRAKLLKGIKEAMEKDTNLANLMVDPGFAADLNSRQMAWRRAITLGVANGIAMPSMSAALAYYDQYRRENLPANLIQGQRDFFGGHTYERKDKPGIFHTLWDDTHKDIGDLSGRTAGEV